jgi:hypothetical protein
MSSRPRPAGAPPCVGGMPALDAAPDVALTLPADRRAAFRARGEIHRLLRDVHPQRRAVAARLVGALLDSATASAGKQEAIELRLWRSPGLLRAQLRSAARLRVADESRLVLERLADRWELDGAGRTVRFDVRTDLSRSPAA